MSKATRPELPPQKPPVPVHYVGEPKRCCRNCQHFGGHRDQAGAPIDRYGRCRNGISGRLQTNVDESCVRGFYPCCQRWPLHERLRGKWTANPQEESQWQKA